LTISSNNLALTHLVSDCDGVLIDSEAVALDALLNVLEARFGQRARLEALIRPMLGLMIVPLLQALFVELDVAPASAAELEHIQTVVEAECDRRLSAVPGVALALAAIDLPKAVASNSSNVRVHEALARTGLAPLFGGRIFTADIVPRPKPFPDVYLAAAAGFGVAPGHCLALEDSVTGVTAAAAAGMTVLGFMGGGHIAEGQAERLRAAGALACFDDMAALPALVAQLRQRQR
jgi:HAD superfamily hydrolase (TIGR01509 family)